MSINEDVQRGLDIARYYQDLLDHPPSLVPYNPKPLQILIQRCKKEVTPEDAFIMASLAGPLSSKGWEIVESENFKFPDDNGPHFNIRNEWWYLACNLDIPNQNKPLSILFVIMRRGTVPPYMRRSGQDGKNAQVVFSQAYVTLPQKNHHYSSRHYTSGNKSTMSANPFYIAVSDNLYFKSNEKDSVFPMSVVINDPTSKIDIHLNLSTNNTPDWFPQGNNGCAPCISGLGYRYYSWPNISVQGTVKVDDVSFTSIKGKAWLDHQWGARMNPLGYLSSYYLRVFNNVLSFFKDSPRINTRWNWFFLQLNDNTEITTVVIPAPEPKDEGVYNLTHTTIISSGKERLVKKDINGQVKYLSLSKSPYGTVYPNEWEIHFPEEDLKLKLTPTVKNQFGYSADNSEFLEAGVVVTGTKNDKEIYGTGFAECIAYQSDHDFIQTSLHTLGFTSDDNENLIPEFYPVKPGGGLFTLSLFILLLPIILLALIITFMVIIIQTNMKR